ncbi:MAG TPA: FGGY family carbohydrate kinase [Chitinophagaceae bacterium]|nr:FGGY family carbohydrate kinase [Chitinophagaceae bacterium]
MEKKEPIIAVFDIGKTNKKLLLFNKRYEVVAEEATSFPEIIDEDGFPCEDLDRLTEWMRLHVEALKRSDTFQLKAINFSTYGASLVLIGKEGERIMPLLNYLKPYTAGLLEQFTSTYGGEEKIAIETSSPMMGHLNAGLQLYWLKKQRPELFAKLSSVLHFPQYLSFLFTGRTFAEMTNLGCHSAMWNFDKKTYHEWLEKEGAREKVNEVVKGNTAVLMKDGDEQIAIGVGLHDSSAAVIPYLNSFSEPFVIVSTGTWTISLNPFNQDIPDAEELASGCLSYLTYEGDPVKASMNFAGHDHDTQVNRIAAFFGLKPAYFHTLEYDAKWVGYTDGIKAVQPESLRSPTTPCVFHTRDLGGFESPEHAYHQLLVDIINRQQIATSMVLRGKPVSNMYVDGGFCKNKIYMQLLTDAFPSLEVYATSMVQGTALGAALAIHDHWNDKPVPGSLIHLRHWKKSEVTGITGRRGKPGHSVVDGE